ncbi:hypothetical protein HA402_006809 [Bradysia odoriphaga]|nr:hypothetical protein HA402_006809 [Bradysia odoriphaga]
MEIEQRHQAAENEKMARKLQKELFSDKRAGMPPMPPGEVIPPNVFPKKANIQQYSPTVVNDAPISPSPTNSRLNYVSLDLSNPPAKMIQQRSPYNEQQHHHYDHINLQSHTPEKKQQPHFDQNNRQKTPTKISGHVSPPLYANAEPTERHPNRTVSPDHYENSSVRTHQQTGHAQSVSNETPPARPERTDKQHEMLKQTDAFKRMKNQSESTRAQFERLSLEKYDQIMGNYEADDHCDGAQGGDDVELNVNRQRNNGNADRIKAMQELGVPADEIIEIDRRIAQQERDEEFARLLQQQENKNLTFEEQDRLVAMEAQDKELARMLQERERAKAKRAKERARQRKLQQKQEESENASSSHSRTHSELDGDSYSDPIDLLANNDGSKPTHPSRDGNVHQTQAQHIYYQDAVNLYDANYSNPVDLIRSTSRSPTSSGSKQSANHRYDDDMYERPINDVEYNGPKRPNNLDIRHLNRPHQPARPPKPDRDELGNIATVIDPTYVESKGSPTTPNSIAQHNQAPNLPDFLDQSSSSVPPPYMPIQGTRRNISLDNNKKKKGKDKCTHQ